MNMAQSLMLIWYSSLVLAITALSTFLALAIRRAWAERCDRLNSQLLDSIKQKLYPLLDLSNDELREKLPGRDFFTTREKPLLGHLCVQLCHRIKGQDRQKLVQIMLNTGFNTESLGELKHGNRDERHAATIALQYFDDRESLIALNRTLHDEDIEVCLSAAHALYNLGQLPDLDLLLELLEGRNILDRQEANQLLQRIGMTEPAQLVRALNTRNNSAETRAFIARGMGYASDFSVIDSLTELASDDAPGVRAEALESLRRLEHPAAEEAIINAISDSDFSVRLAAIRAAGDIHLQSALIPLANLLSSRNWMVRFNAALALFQLGDSGREHLLARATSSDSAGLISALVLSEHKVI